MNINTQLCVSFIDKYNCTNTSSSIIIWSNTFCANTYSMRHKYIVSAGFRSHVTELERNQPKIITAILFVCHNNVIIAFHVKTPQTNILSRDNAIFRIRDSDSLVLHVN
jgi:hypothetical protein